MRIVVTILLLVSGSFVFAQQNTTPPVVGIDTSTSIFSKVEVEASVDRQQWIDHLTNNLQSVIVKAAKKGMKAGRYDVNVKFLVEKDGSITDVQALNDPGYGLAKAAVKVLKSGPRWSAGELNGKKVRSYHTQPITFVIQEI
jgi:periplasmic protein TonB